MTFNTTKMVFLKVCVHSASKSKRIRYYVQRGVRYISGLSPPQRLIRSEVRAIKKHRVKFLRYWHNLGGFPLEPNTWLKQNVRPPQDDEEECLLRLKEAPLSGPRVTRQSPARSVTRESPVRRVTRESPVPGCMTRTQVKR